MSKLVTLGRQPVAGYSEEHPRTVELLHDLVEGKLGTNSLVYYRGYLGGDIKRCTYNSSSPHAGHAPRYMQLLLRIKATAEVFAEKGLLELSTREAKRSTKHARDIPFFEYVATRVVPLPSTAKPKLAVV